MASLDDLLSKTMLFTAAKDAGIDPKSLKLGAGAPIAFKPPYEPPPAVDDIDPATQAVWHWKHDPGAPAKVEALTAFVRAAGPKGMPMPVCPRIEVESVTIKVRADDDTLELPLTSKYVLTKFFLNGGTIKGGGSGWWRLPANVDRSMLIVFGYELQRASGVAPKPIDPAVIESLGPHFFPDPDVPASDPDAAAAPSSHIAPPAIVGIHQSVTAYVAPTWVIVTFGLTTCKERADFEPGEVLGAGRIYPHVMVTCNVAAAQVESKIHVVRPGTTMVHDAEMKPNMGSILITDTNAERSIFPEFMTSFGVIPVWSNFFDYYDLNPPLGKEYCFVNPDKTGSRNVVGGIQREDSLHVPSLYEKSSTFVKLPRQGEFDNLHVAPRMKYAHRGLLIDDIVMAPFCEHDCLHTHMRWGKPGPTIPFSNLGFVGRQPLTQEGAPTVPANQEVFVSLTSPTSFRYRAVARGPVQPATFSVFFHHGSGYALAIASPAKVFGAKGAVKAYAIASRDPYVRIKPGVVLIPPFTLPIPDVDMEHADPTDSTAAFYQRLQFMGTNSPDDWKPRIRIINLDLCRTT